MPVRIARVSEPQGHCPPIPIANAPTARTDAKMKCVAALCAILHPNKGRSHPTTTSSTRARRRPLGPHSAASTTNLSYAARFSSVLGPVRCISFRSRAQGLTHSIEQEVCDRASVNVCLQRSLCPAHKTPSPQSHSGTDVELFRANNSPKVPIDWTGCCRSAARRLPRAAAPGSPRAAPGFPISY